MQIETSARQTDVLCGLHDETEPEDEGDDMVRGPQSPEHAGSGCSMSTPEEKIDHGRSNEVARIAGPEPGALEDLGRQKDRPQGQNDDPPNVDLKGWGLDLRHAADPVFKMVL